MKVFKLLLILTFCIHATAVFSQTDKSGVYLNYADYQLHKLTYEIDCKRETHKIRLNAFFGKPFITVIHQGKRYTYQKNDIYGFRDCSNTDYRFFKKQDFKIEESGPIAIYSQKVTKSTGRSLTQFNTYYFSKSQNSEILALTVENLKPAFPENHKFHDLLDANFKNNDPASTYDAFHKIFKVNHLYTISIAGKD